jgi:hypothetical protein
VHGGALGEACGGDAPCDVGLFCRWQGGQQLCSPLSTAGEACFGAEECEPGLVCRSSTGLCETPGDEGASCWVTTECMPELYCAFDTCALRPVEGESCSDAPCAAGLGCDTLTDPMAPVCRAPLGDGEPCNSFAQCASGYCPVGHCAAKPGEGESCAVLGQCAEGLRCDAPDEPDATCTPNAGLPIAVCGWPGF